MLPFNPLSEILSSLRLPRGRTPNKYTPHIGAKQQAKWAKQQEKLKQQVV